ncbi:MAG: metallophosphoesterase [Bacteroidetes bacterium]|nr:metallophosphoesterase [Bacteroidota bacterium]
MKIQYCSDLHLEFPENDLLLQRSPLEVAGDVLILSGDIVPFRFMSKFAHFFDYISDHYKTVYWLPGNHEYYGSDASERSGEVYEEIRSNVFLVNNIAVKEGDLRLVFSTLWAYIHPDNEYFITKGISDFRAIKYKHRQLQANHFNYLHHTCMTFLKNTLNEKVSGQTIVATHHVPTKLNYPAQYKNSVYNDAFVVELYDLIADTQPDYWIYGHHHTNTPAFNIEKTVLLTNQLGYVHSGEHLTFNRGAYVSID